MHSMHSARIKLYRLQASLCRTTAHPSARQNVIVITLFHGRDENSISAHWGANLQLLVKAQSTQVQNSRCIISKSQMSDMKLSNGVKLYQIVPRPAHLCAGTGLPCTCPTWQLHNKTRGRGASIKVHRVR